MSFSKDVITFKHENRNSAQKITFLLFWLSLLPKASQVVLLILNIIFDSPVAHFYCMHIWNHITIIKKRERCCFLFSIQMSGYNSKQFESNFLKYLSFSLLNKHFFLQYQRWKKKPKQKKKNRTHLLSHVGFRSTIIDNRTHPNVIDFIYLFIIY